jgi:hypothetical protein
VYVASYVVFVIIIFVAVTNGLCAIVVNLVNNDYDDDDVSHRGIKLDVLNRGKHTAIHNSVQCC